MFFLLLESQHCAFNTWEPVRSWEVRYGAEGTWHCCIPCSALAAVSCEGSPVEEVVPALNGSFTKAGAAQLLPAAICRQDCSNLV